MATITWTNFKSALVTIILTAVLTMAIYIVGLGDYSLIDSHTLTNIGFIALLNGVISIIKSFLTTDTGKFLGVTQVK